MGLGFRCVICLVVGVIEFSSAFTAAPINIVLHKLVLRSSKSKFKVNNHNLRLDDDNSCTVSRPSRRSILISPIVVSLGLTLTTEGNTAFATDGNLNQIVGQLKASSQMLDEIPDLIKAEKWDAIRAILIKPPLSDLWASGGTKQLLKSYADAIGNELPDGDEMAALELREDAISHLRYLDMAVYNNVFNPIGTEGQSGATKELIRSYYEDPINEWNASKAALESLIGLATP